MACDLYLCVPLWECPICVVIDSLCGYGTPYNALKMGCNVFQLKYQHNLTRLQRSLSRIHFKIVLISVIKRTFFFLFAAIKQFRFSTRRTTEWRKKKKKSCNPRFSLALSIHAPDLSTWNILTTHSEKDFPGHALVSTPAYISFSPLLYFHHVRIM